MERNRITALRGDEPIRGADQDQLSRVQLVHVIGAHVLRVAAPESVVIGLNAPWGAGKSSFLNLLQEHLQAAAESDGGDASERHQTPIIVRFNPWLYTNVEQLVRMFFLELARAIGTAKRQELTHRIGELLRALGSIAAIVSSGAGDLLKDVGASMKESKSLPELKAELDKLLPELTQRVVIFVDDIDRLERDAMRILFRVIRLSADFSNVTYVLAFDRLVVERSLDEQNGIKGRDYLEKIIQVSFDIPKPEPATISRILFAEMDDVLQSVETRELDQHRWGNVFLSGFRDHFRTIRHVKRYTNGLRLTLGSVAMEVDLVDFLVIELFRVFHPEVYLEMAQGRDMLAPVRAGDHVATSADHLKHWVDKLCGNATAGFDGHVRELLRQLFPELARAYDRTTYGEDFHAQWRRDCRVCSREMFEKFFLLAVPFGEVSEFEMRALVDGLSNREWLKDYLQRAVESGKARRLLERLEDYTTEFPAEHVAHLVSTLFDLGDELRFESRGFLDLTADMQVPRLIYQALMRLQSDVDRQGVLLKCVADGVGLYTLVQEVLLSEPRVRQTEQGLLSDRDLWEPLRDAALHRIRHAAAAGDLWRVHRLPFVLFRWMEWSTEEEVQAAVRQHVTDDVVLLEFLTKFIASSHWHSMGDKISRKHMLFNRRDLEALLPLDEVRERLRSISERGEVDVDVVRRLVELIEKSSEHPLDE